MSIISASGEITSRARETTLTLFVISPEAEIILILVRSRTLIPLDIFW